MRIRMRASNFFAVILLTLLISLVFAAPLYGERPTSGNGQAIKDAVAGVLAKTDTLVTNIGNLCDLNCQSTDAGKVFSRKVGRIKDAQRRAVGTHNRTSAAEYGKVNRKNNKKKSVDGCDPEVAICVDAQSVMASSGASTDEPEIDEEQGKDTIEDLNEIAADVDELNEVLAGNVPPPLPTKYAELENANYYFPENMWPSTTTLFLSFMASQVAEKAAAVADKMCQQTWVALGTGGNGSLGCIVTVTIHEVLKMAYNGMEFIDQDKASSEINGTYRRVGNVYAQLLGSSGDINAIKMVVDAMGKKMLELEKNQLLIIELLKTPQGQRSGFPSPTK